MKAIWRVVRFTTYLWPWYVGAMVGVIITALLSLASPLILKEVVDQVVNQLTHQGGDMEMIWWLLGLMLGLQVLQIVVQSVGGWVGDMIEVKLRVYLSAIFYEKLLSLDTSFFDNTESGKTINKFYRGISQITGFIQGMLNNFLPMVLTAVVTVILIAFYSWVLALLLAALFPIYVLISHRSSVSWIAHEGEKNTLSDKALGRSYESIAGIRTVKSFAQEQRELEDFKQYNDDIIGITSRQSRGWHGYDFARTLVLNGILFASMAYILYHTFTGRYTIGEMTLLIQLVQQARMPLFAMSFIMSQVQRVDAGSQDYFQIMNTPTEVNDDPEAPDLVSEPDSLQGPMVRFQDVRFSYDQKNEVLRGVDLSLQAGQKLALVGESGQGKSTIIQLLLRFYQPQSGHIYIAGQDIAKVSQRSLRQSMAVVFQEAWLFSGSVIDNIRYGRPEATETEVIEAAKAANADVFIRDLPNGYDSLVGERGVKLSGGQKQRISIARAILKDAPLIILDEATSALDSRSELLVQEGLDRLMEGRTSIIIAHRLSTVAEADQIAVVDQGKIAEQGSPEDLLANPDSLYAALVALQQSLTGASAKTRRQALKQYDLVG